MNIHSRTAINLTKKNRLLASLAPAVLLSLLVTACAGTGQPLADKNLLRVPASAFIAVSDLSNSGLRSSKEGGSTHETDVSALKLQQENSDRDARQSVDSAGTHPDVGFAVLSYHRVDVDKSRYTVSPEAFAEQIRYLRANNYHTLTTDELLKYYQEGADLPAKSVLITIDDGHRSSFRHVHQLLSEYGFNALYFPYSDFINNGGLSASMMRDMLATGFVEFGLHSKTHAALTEQWEQEKEIDYRQRILYELTEPTVRIQRITGKTPTSIAYPYGKVNRQVERWSREQGVLLGFTVNCALNNRTTNPLRLNRCTLLRADNIDMFATKLERPKVALARLERADSESLKSKPPEFLGHLSDREFFTGLPIEPFAAYFVDPEGERLSYAAPGLPVGLQIDKKTGEISGTPSNSVKVAEITVEAVDETGAIARSNRFKVVVY